MGNELHLLCYGDIITYPCYNFNNGLVKAALEPGPLFTKTPSYGYRDPHYKPKTV